MAKASVKFDRLTFERQLWARGVRCIAGVDEAGRGPLAGPVVAAAVVLPRSWLEFGPPQGLEELNDSKQLTERQRTAFFNLLTAQPGILFAVARVDADIIDQINILQATHRAINLALSQLHPTPQHVLVDGGRVDSLHIPQTALIKGDSRSYSIAAASVLAKVTRDRLMREYDRQWPQYGFAENKGYGTARHIEALTKFGPCPIHRKSFAPLRETQKTFFEGHGPAI